MSLATYASKTHQKSWNKSDEISDSTNSFFFFWVKFSLSLPSSLLKVPYGCPFYTASLISTLGPGFQSRGSGQNLNSDMNP